MSELVTYKKNDLVFGGGAFVGLALAHFAILYLISVLGPLGVSALFVMGFLVFKYGDFNLTVSYIILPFLIKFQALSLFSEHAGDVFFFNAWV